jgi:protein-S-isoprenylcysteine O-methyltransferase Ste14
VIGFATQFAVTESPAWLPVLVPFLYGTWMLAGVVKRKKSVCWDRVRSPGSTYLLFAFLAGNILVSAAEGLFRGPPPPLLAAWAGAGLIASKVAVTVWSIRTLGASYSYHLSVGLGAGIVRTGPYRWVRHPMYAARLLATIGIPLAFGAWICLPVFLALDLGAVLYRIREEEKLLAEDFGSAYGEYAEEVGAILPFRALVFRFAGESARREYRIADPGNRIEAPPDRSGETETLSTRSRT